MAIDLTNISAGQIAIITASASVVAAITAGVFALVVAFVNGRHSVRIEREKALRQYKLDVLKRVVKLSRYHVRLFQRVIELRGNPDDAELTAVQEALTIRDGLVANDPFNDTLSLIPTVRASRHLSTAVERAWRAHKNLLQDIMLHEDDLWALERTLREFEASITLLKQQTEKDLFG